MLKTCERCGKENKRGGRLCSACHNREYRATPGGRQHVRDANAAYARRAAKDPVKRARRLATERRWKQSAGIYTPELQRLRKAINRLDAAVQVAEGRSRVFGPGEPDRNDGPERGD